MKRLFIALRIEPGAELLRVFSTMKALCGNENIKWADTSNIHLTLVFLGDTEEKKIKTLSLMLKDKCSAFGGFDFVVKGTGIFKNFRDPRVIWMGIQQSSGLEQLAESIREGLSTAGFITEERKFMPHLTLGRIRSVKNPDNLKTVIEKYRDTEIQRVNVEEVILYESILLPAGPLYKALGRFALS